MRVALFLWGNRVYSPGMRANLDLASAVGKLSERPCAVLIDSSPEVAQEARRRLGDANVGECRDLRELPRVVQKLGPDVVYSKDHIQSLRALDEVGRALKVRTVAFTSGFYELEKLRSGMLSYAFRTRRYASLLRGLSGIVAISHYCEMLLELLFDLRPLGVVYPSIDAGLYRPPDAGASRSGVLVFAGPEGNRPVAEYLPALRSLPSSVGPIHLFGDAGATSALQAQLGTRAERHVEVPEAELVRLYGGVRATYITSEWEGFGLVGPESLLCGTPVVLDVVQPWMELTGESEVVRVGRSPKEIVKFLTEPPNADAPALPPLRVHLSEALSPQVCAARFLRALSHL